MRYVNLKKRNTSKLQYVVKRVANVSMICLSLTAVIVVPLISKAKTLQANNGNQDVEIVNGVQNQDVELAYSDCEKLVVKY